MFKCFNILKIFMEIFKYFKVFMKIFKIVIMRKHIHHCPSNLFLIPFSGLGTMTSQTR